MEIDSFEELAERRKTVKVLATESLPVTDHRAIVDRCMAAAGWAPFHKVCSSEHRLQTDLPGIEPWRFHALDATSCQRLANKVLPMEAAGKIPAMLASADAMIMATWLPNPPAVAAAQPSDSNEFFEPTIGNVEHIAAASAAIQSLLLAATAGGFQTYWSSGGVLRSAEIFQQLGIAASERLLGAIFIFPANISDADNVEIAESKLRGQRSPLSAWARWIELPQ